MNVITSYVKFVNTAYEKSGFAAFNCRAFHKAKRFVQENEVIGSIRRNAPLVVSAINAAGVRFFEDLTRKCNGETEEPEVVVEPVEEAV